MNLKEELNLIVIESKFPSYEEIKKRLIEKARDGEWTAEFLMDDISSDVIEKLKEEGLIIEFHKAKTEMEYSYYLIKW